MKLPRADSIRIEPSGKRIESAMQAIKIATFIEGLPGSWETEWSTPAGVGTILLFHNGSNIVSTVRITGDQIYIYSGTSPKVRMKKLSRANRENLDILLQRAN